MDVYLQIQISQICNVYIYIYICIDIYIFYTDIQNYIDIIDCITIQIPHLWCDSVFPKQPALLYRGKLNWKETKLINKTNTSFTTTRFYIIQINGSVRSFCEHALCQKEAHIHGMPHVRHAPCIQYHFNNLLATAATGWLKTRDKLCPNNIYISFCTKDLLRLTTIRSSPNQPWQLLVPALAHYTDHSFRNENI